MSVFIIFIHVTGLVLALQYLVENSLRSWRGFARESIYFGCEAVKVSDKAVRGLVKGAQSRCFD